MIHENFDEKECYDNGCKPPMLKMGVFEVVDEKEEMEHEIKKSVKDGARGTRGACLDDKRKQERVQHLRETDEYFHSSINAEMLTIAARTHAV